MAHVIPVDDPADDRLADYTRLTDVDLRTALEPALGLFVAEGELVVGRALRAGYPPRSALVLDRWAEPMCALLAGADVPVYAGSRAVLAGVTGFDVHRGVLASFARTPLPDVPALLAQARRVAVLEDFTNPTNVGAVFRGAAGLGMDAVVVSPRCADPLYRRSVRVSMGEVFALPYARPAAWPGALDDVRAAGFRLLALTPAADATPLDAVAVAPGDRVALLLGAEGDGLTGTALARADERVRIPMSRGVDSLNVAAAAAVAFWVVGSRDAP